MNYINYDTVEIVGLKTEYPVNSTTFKQFENQQILELPPKNSDMKKIIRVTTRGEVLSTKITKIPQAVSNEGQRLTGNKLIIEGRIILEIEYIAINSDQSVHIAEFVNPFSSYIMLEKDFYCSDPINVSVYIVDFYARQINSKKILSNTIILLNACRINYPTLSANTYENRYNEYLNREKTGKKSFFSQLSVQETIMLPEVKPDIKTVITSITEPEVVSLRFIDTMKGISEEGQILTGKQAAIEIKFKQKTLYEADVSSQSIHGIESEFYKCAYVVFPSNLEGTDPEILLKNKLLKPQITIEDILTKPLDNRTIFENITLLIEIKLVPTFEICYSHHNSETESSIFMMYPEGNCEIPLTTNDNCRCIKPQWSPMGNEIAYLKGDEQGYMLYLLNIKNLKSIQVTSFKRFDNITSFSWTGRGKRIIFTASIHDSKDIYTYDIANQSFSRLTNGNDRLRNFNPVSSPDENKIAYIKSSSGAKTIWIMDTHGKNSFQLTEEGQIRGFQWSMDSSSIIYIDSKEYGNDALYIIDIFSKKIRLLVDNPFIHKIKKVKISPDNRFAAFITTNNHREDLFVYELTTGELKALTEDDYSSGISDLIWKIDSTIIYYALKDMDYYNIYSVDLHYYFKKQLTRINSNFIEMSYRPTIK